MKKKTNNRKKHLNPSWTFICGWSKRKKHIYPYLQFTPNKYLLRILSSLKSYCKKWSSKKNKKNINIVTQKLWKSTPISYLAGGYLHLEKCIWAVCQAQQQLEIKLFACILSSLGNWELSSDSTTTNLKSCLANHHLVKQI